ncbi:helix-turn-helix transcriptional regulator [Chryseobacterium sp. MYb328]|uniref:helix-turn-helix transcriptional regulator n=1 Tax=Chryseobacterium sp. MYb328 TaxID=2745231 RepID=UPI00309E14A4
MNIEDVEKNNRVSCYLKDYFAENNISQKEIQDALNVSQQYVSGFINGKRSIGKRLAEKLSSLYGIDKAFLLTGEFSKIIQKEPTNLDIKNLPHDKQMEILHNDLLELKKENEELKDMVDSLTLKIEISLAPILRHFKLKEDSKDKQRDKSSIN